MENSRQQLMHKIQMYEFYLYELNLYLDSHPTCQRGLNTFRKYKRLRDEAVKMYNMYYGPITATESDCDTVFEWVKGPWPWEKEGN